MIARGVPEDPGREVVGELRVALVVRVVLEPVLARLEVGEAHVHVRAGAEVLIERLRHERRDAPERAGDVLGHQAEEHHPVGHLERVGVAELELVLPVPALVVERVDVPAELGHVLDHRLQERVGEDRRLEVVAARRRVEEVLGDPGRPLAVDVAQDIDLGLHADVERVAELGGGRELALEHAARVVRVRLAVVLEVGRRDREAPVPRQDHEPREVGDAEALVLVGAELAHALERADRVELGALRHRVDVVHRDALGLRDAVRVDVGAEQVADALLAQVGEQRGAALGGRVELDGHVSLPKVTLWSPGTARAVRRPP